MRMIYYILLCILFSCKGETSIIENNYILDHSLTLKYKNDYNDKGLLIRVQEVSIFESFVERAMGKTADSYENIYTYDQRDSLINKKVYSVYEDNERELYSEELYTDSTRIYTSYRSYPSDTLSYMYAKKDSRGNFFEYYKYDKVVYMDEAPQTYKSKTFDEYDHNNKLIYSKRTDLVHNTTEEESYIYSTSTDTLETKVFKGKGTLWLYKKKYNTKEYTIEVSEYYDSGSIDSLFYKNNKEVRWISIQEGTKREQIMEYDQYSNITKSIESIYMTKEAREKQKKEWGID